MAEFAIASYRIAQTLTRSGTPLQTRRERVIDLTSVTQFHGLVARVSLVFSTQFDAWTGSPVVGYAQALNTFQPQLAGWYPVADFEAAYAVLRTESPVYLSYDLQSPTAVASYITRLALRTVDEPVGDAAMAAGLSVIRAPKAALPEALSLLTPVELAARIELKQP